ncbi:MAG: DUF2490 domain-containing protein [Draconibacterium sp.]|nr:DUF2490 domain-containing protein [Draconibacterium sp.]
MRKRGLIIIIFLLTCVATQAKTKKFGTWIEFEFSKELFKKFELSFIPEVRLQDDFTVDEYLFDSKLSYEPMKYLTLATTYRINTNVRNKGNETTKRFVFDATGKKGFGRFDASLRARLTNYTDLEDGEEKANHFRPRLKLTYDIKGNKIRPFASYELFHNLSDKELTKTRFDLGFTRKIGELHRIGLYYRLHNYTSDKNSINILGIDYRLKF